MHFYISIQIVHRKKDDPPPQRKSSAGARKLLTNESMQFTTGGDTYQITNPIPKISTYIRRKSESYLARHSRSEERRSQLSANEGRLPSQNHPTETTNQAQVHMEEGKEVDHNQEGLQENAVKNKGELL